MDGTRTIDMVARLRSLAAGGSPAEKRLAAIVLDSAETASAAPIRALAQWADVSEPTVTRFCRALDCEGLRDFKLRLAQIVAIGGFSMFPGPIHRSPYDESIITSVRDGAIGAIQRTAATLDMTLIAKAAEAIAGARQVVAFGSGGVSSMGAVELENRLFRFAIPVTAHTDGQMQRMVAAVAGPGTVAVSLSSSGSAPSVVEATQIARDYGATTIAITEPGSALAGRAEIVLGFKVPGDGVVIKPSASRYALLTVVDVLATSVAEAVGPSALEGLRRIRKSLAALGMSNSDRPIGD
ncbi:MurR/RpiR family transcriptional regulator [Acuticoccus sp. MNP-M23]|uniref:MurR/RpiR family transcriptional regulator n=1 Tax=Acuticoccus sp. MNP-M23 TaxID=3072793 RepID=UPI00281679E2|nr:MurR/RpiR family transcriptional regulator [Acuticoccus sp. MNP-M23]WMS43944.1 MurR/RpiR family transcriptional regulator [Acuticoccus sp. MNP-M23]